MPGRVPGIHDLAVPRSKTWMAGPSPAMTEVLDKIITAKALSDAVGPEQPVLRAFQALGSDEPRSDWNIVALKQPNHLLWDEGLTESDKQAMTDINASLDRLNGLRAVEINVAEHFARSKIAWKLATYQHALLHRIVALMDGTAVAWNNRCTLSAILSARALMETIAVMDAFENGVTNLLAGKDLVRTR